MDVDALIDAAREIDRKAELQEDRARKLRELAAEARKVVSGSPEHRAIQARARMMTTQVVDFGDSINALRRALHAKPR